jgi:hypothetical protein
MVDSPGTYIAHLIVHDGVVSGAPDTVAVIASTMDADPADLRLDPPDGALLSAATIVLTITYGDDESGVDLASLRAAACSP